MDKPLYHEGNRALQDRFDSRRIADRLEQVTLHDWFTDDNRDFVTRCAMFFLATADAQGQPDVSYKGGVPGFVRLVDDRTLAFPDYDGNGMFKSLGNILANPRVGLLFVDFEEPNRMRVSGTASGEHARWWMLCLASRAPSECASVDSSIWPEKRSNRTGPLNFRVSYSHREVGGSRTPAGRIRAAAPARPASGHEQAAVATGL